MQLTAREWRIQMLEQWPIRGNAYADRHLFKLAHDIAADPDETLERRGRALAAIDRAMGEPPLNHRDEDLVRVALADYLSLV